MIINYSKMENNNENVNNQLLETNNVEKKDKSVKGFNWKPDDLNNNTKEKLNYPKRKYAIIHGYNGLDFKGNQK